MANNDNIARLTEAGILNPSWQLVSDDIQALESLTADEVSTIIAVKAKLGESFFQAHVKPRADFIF